MKFLNKKNIIIGLIVLVFILLFFWKQSSNQLKEISTAFVVKGELVQSVDPSGSVKSTSEINLNFDTVGRIAKIYVNVGDIVQEGQILANLETRNYDSVVIQAQADLAKARGNLAAFLAGSSLEVIAQYEAEVQKAQANLNKVKVDLDNLKASLEQSYKNSYNNQITNLQGIISSLETSMTDMDSVLGLENTFSNDAYDLAIVNLDNQSFFVSSANQSFYSARSLINDFKKDLVILESNREDLNFIDTVTENAKKTLDAVATALNNTWTVLDKIDVSNPSLAVDNSMINSKKILIDADRSSVSAKKTVILSGQQNIATAKLNYGLTAGSSGASQVAQYEANIAIYEAALASAKASLEAKKAAPRQVDLESYKASVQAAEAGLLAAQANRNKAFIYSPVNGIVTQKNNEAGESTSSGKAVLVVLANSEYEIEVNVSEADIAKVQVGQDANVTLDSFGDDYIFKGKVTTIDPAETLISDVVYYKVKVSIDYDESLQYGQNITEQHLKDIKTGMTTSVVIFTNKKSNVLMVPERAVFTKEGKKIIRVMVDSKKQEIIEKEVTVGLRGNEGMIEIVSGLTEGEEIVTFIKN